MNLNDPTLFGEKVPVAGRWVGCDGRETAAILNPATGEIVGRVPELGAKETREAIASAVIA